jgi:hypothetical protein
MLKLTGSYLKHFPAVQSRQLLPHSFPYLHLCQQSKLDKRDSLKRKNPISGRLLCVLTRFTGRMCNIQWDHPVGGSFTRGFFPHDYRNSADISLFIPLLAPGTITAKPRFPHRLPDAPHPPLKPADWLSISRRTSPHRPRRRVPEPAGNLCHPIPWRKRRRWEPYLSGSTRRWPHLAWEPLPSRRL